MLRRARERGAAAVEFAMVLPVLLLLLGGVIDFGSLYYNQIVLSNAARDGARLVAANSAASPLFTQSQIQTAIQNSAGTSLLVNSSAPAWTCAASNTSVTVTVTRRTAFRWTVLGFVPALPTPTPTGKATITCA